MELKNLQESVDALASRAGLTQAKAFAAWYAINFGGVDEDFALEAAAIDGGNDQGIDIIYADEQYQRIFVLQSFVPGSSQNFQKPTKLEKWNAVVASIPHVTDTKSLRSSGRNDAADFIEEITQSFPGFEITFGLISLGRGNVEIERAVAAAASSEIYKDYSFIFLPQEKILEEYSILIEEEGGIPEEEITFAGGFFKDEGAYGLAYVGSISAMELVRIYKKYPSKIFSGNIRLFLGARKGGINEKIIKTAKENPDGFWALNNGITIVADSITEKKRRGSGGSIIAKRFSIVNGCQTTSCLVKAGKEGGAAKVLVRIIAAKAGIKSDIVLYNNSQNAVKIWAVRAADDTQELLKKQLAKVNIQYAPKRQGTKKQSTENTIELDRVTQFLAASKQEFLVQAINNKAELFDEPYSKIFKKGIAPEKVLIAWKVGQLSDNERSEQLSKIDKDAYSGLLGVQSTLWIVYTTYKLLDKFSTLESPHVTLERIIHRDFLSGLQKYVNKAVELYYGEAINTYDYEEYGSIKSTLRSNKFLEKMNSKLNMKINNLKKSELKNLETTAKSISATKL